VIDLHQWNTPTRSPNPPTAYFDEPSQAPVPTATQRCIGFFPEDTCMVEAEVKQQIFAPRSGDNLVNVNFGHALAFINDNIIAAATDGSAPGAGVHIFYKSDGMNAYDHFQTLYGDQQNLVNNKFGYSLATSKNTNTLIVGAPSRNASDVKVDCVQQWCELCSWSATDSTPCGERLDIIVQSSAGDEDQIKQQIMTTGQCIADEICNEVVTAGAVYIYEPTGSAWERVSILTSDDPSFGSVVAMDEGVIAIGSPYQDKVTIYEKTGNSWTLLETKVSLAKGVKFGASLSLSGGALVIGAPLDGVGGVAYVYARSARSFVPLGQPLVPRDISPGDNFGEKVSVSGCTVAVSSSNDITASTTGTGSIRIFNYDYNLDYFSADQIVEPTEDVTGVFPECLVMKGNDLLVGSSSGRSSGILTHFTRRNNVWTYKSVISNPHQDGGSAAGVFGCGLSISGSKALVGAKGTEQGPPGSSALCPDDELI